MPILRSGCLALLGLMVALVDARGDPAASAVARESCVYPVEVIVMQIDAAGKKQAVGHHLLPAQINDGLLHTDRPAAGVEASSRIEEGKRRGEYVPFGFECKCCIRSWDPDRVALEVCVKAGTLPEDGKREIIVVRSKLVRPGQAITLKIPRSDLIPELGDNGGRFVIRFRLREPSKGTSEVKPGGALLRLY